MEDGNHIEQLLDILSRSRIAAAQSFDARVAPRLRSLKLKRFETCLQCLNRQVGMLDLFISHPPDNDKWPALANCDANTCALDECTEGCHLGTMKRRLAALDSGLPILAAHAGPKWDVSLVHPLWEAAPGKLARIRMKGALQWNYRRLRKLNIPGLLSMGIFEVSLNRNLSGEVYWAGGIHQIVCGASEDELRRAFEIPRRHRDYRPKQRMVYIAPVERLATQFAYAQKRFVEERRAFVSSKTGRQTCRHLPLRAQDQAEHDAWLLSLPIGGRTILFGCSRRGTTIFPAAGGVE